MNTIKYIIVDFPTVQVFGSKEYASECLYVDSEKCKLSVPEYLYNNVMNIQQPETILCTAVKRKTPRTCNPYDEQNDICVKN